MKTKNNVQKAVLRSVAVIVSFILLSFTVSAQSFWKRLLENSSFSHIAMAMVNPIEDHDSKEVSEVSGKTFMLETEIESALELEAWMTEESNFDVVNLYFPEEPEEAMLVEDWMMDEGYFRVNVEKEKSLALEDWMISENIWEI